MEKKEKQLRVFSFLVRKKWWTAAGCALAAAAILLLSGSPAIMTAAAARQLPIYCVQRDQKVCALSFDAAWGDV